MWRFYIRNHAERRAAIGAHAIDNQICHIGREHVRVQQLRVCPMRPLLRTRVFGLHGLPEGAHRPGVRTNVGWRFVAPNIFFYAGDDCILQNLAARFPRRGLLSDVRVRSVDGVPYATEITQSPCRESIVRKIR